MNMFGQSKNMVNHSNDINMSKATNITDSSSFINSTSINKQKLSQIDEISPTRKVGVNVAADSTPLYVPTRRDNNENIDVNNSQNSGAFKGMLNRRDRNESTERKVTALNYNS